MMMAPRLHLTVDVVLLTVSAGNLHALLVRRPGLQSEGCWALPGDEVGAEESLESAAARVAAGVAGLQVYLEQLRTYGEPDRDPRGRVVSTAYLGLVPGLPQTETRAHTALWPLTGAGGLQVGPRLALDHATILADGVERARSKLEYTSLAAAFVQEPFTLADLRRVYEAVWGARLDPGNFRRKVLSTRGFVEPVGGRAASRPGGGRPARLYRRGRSRLLYPAMLRPGRDPGAGPRIPPLNAGQYPTAET